MTAKTHAIERVLVNELNKAGLPTNFDSAARSEIAGYLLMFGAVAVFALLGSLVWG